MTMWEWEMFMTSKPAEIILQGRKLQKEKVPVVCIVKEIETIWRVLLF